MFRIYICSILEMIFLDLQFGWELDSNICTHTHFSFQIILHNDYIFLIYGKIFLEIQNKIYTYIPFLLLVLFNFFTGFGESIEIAKEMAARDALRRLFRTSERDAPIKFNLVIDSDGNQRVNPTLDEWNEAKLLKVTANT